MPVSISGATPTRPALKSSVVSGIDLGRDADAAGAEVLGGILGVLDGHGGHRGRCLFGHGWSHSASLGWVWVHL